MRLFSKIFATAFVSFVAVTVLISYVIFMKQVAEAENGIVEENRSIGAFISRQIELGYLQSVWPFELLEDLSKHRNFLFWWVVREDGTIHLADQTAFMKTLAGDYLPHLTKLISKNHIFLDREQEYGIFRSPVEIGKRQWSFWLGFSLKDITETKTRLILFDFVVCLSGIMLLGIMLFVLVRHFTKPVKGLSLGTAVIAKGDLTHRVRVETTDELGQLARAFNKMAEELQKRDARIRSIFKAAQHVSFIVTDHAGMDARILEFSPGAERIFGYTSEEAIGKPVAMLHIPDDIAGLPERIEAAGQRETGFITELTLVRKSGERFPALFSSYPICDAVGNVIAALAVSVDIIERKQAEEALSEKHRELQETVQQLEQSQNMLQLIIESIPVRVFWKDRDLCYLGCNSLFARDSGLNDPQQLLGKDDYAMGWREQADLYRSDDRQVMESRRPKMNIVEPQTTPAGTTIWLNTSKVPLQKSSGVVFGVLGIYEDITERKRAEEALRESEIRYRNLVESSNDWVWEVDKNGIYTYASPHCRELLGYEPEELIGRKPFDLMPPDEAGRVEELFASFAARRKSFRALENTNLHKDGYLVVLETNGVPVLDEEGNVRGYRGMNRDITERKRAEEERRRWERQLHQAQKTESLGRMAGAIAHHFNNLLGVVMGNLELATIDLPQGSKPWAQIGEAMAASKRAADISRLMLAYLGKSIGTRAPVELSEVCREALPFLIACIPQRVQLRAELPDRGPVVSADAVQIRQVLTNLVVNAGEAMGDREGDVVVAVHMKPAADIRVSRFDPAEWEPKDEHYACLSVSDIGIGMDPETLEKVFDPFFSTKFPGRGLGLAEVLGVVKAHEGAVTVESAQGRGATFRVFLPLSVEETPRERKPEPADAVLSKDRGSVLLVEDEPMLRNMAQRMLKHLGFEVITASDGVEALEVFRERQEQVQCVLLDLTIPRMDGWETLAALRALRPDLPVILAGGYDEAKVKQGYHPLRPQAFLRKPFIVKDLEAALGAALKASPVDNKEVR